LSGEQSRAQVEERAALRRVATLLARGAAPEEVFAVVTDEVGRLMSVEYAHLGRYEPDGTMTIVAGWGRTGRHVPAGGLWSLSGQNINTLVLETGHPARIDGCPDAAGLLGVAARQGGVGSGLGTPVIVEGRVWGVMGVYSSVGQAMPADTEVRLASFTELVVAAIANAQSRAQLNRLADEQVALRRVAMLVARGVRSAELFAAVAEEVGRLLGSHLAGMCRYESDETLTVLAAWAAEGEHPLVPGPWPLEGGDLASTIWSTGRPVRIDTYRGVPGRIAAFVRDELQIGSSVGSPIVAEGRLWGALFVHSKQTHQPFPADTESRLTGFTELVATAIVNAESRAELARLAEEQAALRRVATLVARGTPPQELFAAVTEEVAQVLPVQYAAMARYESDGAVTIVANSNRAADRFPVGSRWTVDGNNLSRLVFETGRPARIDSYNDASGPLGIDIREEGVASGVGTPIIVEGRLWGVITTRSSREQPMPADTEARLANFTKLVATAIANAESRAALAASRARIVAGADEMRRRIERDLHDGTQQRLVALGLEVRAAEARVPPQLGELRVALSRVAEELASVFDELREISHGIHPAILSEGGLKPALRALRRRSAVPVELDLRCERRLPEPVEVATYYVVSEGLANAAKHARASVVNVVLDTQDEIMRLAIRDDGIGGADPGRGSGLLGLSDRIEALGGTLGITSAVGKGTTLLIELPLEDVSSAVLPEP
jgi:signal transduction histidine kinase